MNFIEAQRLFNDVRAKLPSKGWPCIMLLRGTDVPLVVLANGKPEVVAIVLSLALEAVEQGTGDHKSPLADLAIASKQFLAAADAMKQPTDWLPGDKQRRYDATRNVLAELITEVPTVTLDETEPPPPTA